jgi:hypothetical protein
MSFFVIITPTHQNVMRNSNNYSASSIIAAIEERIKTEKLNLEANRILGNKSECMLIQHRIADARIMLLTFSGDLPL